MKPELICGLPFYTVSNERMGDMTIGEIVEKLIIIKKEFNIDYPYDIPINNACNILNRLPKDSDVLDWIIKNNSN